MDLHIYIYLLLEASEFWKWLWSSSDEELTIVVGCCAILKWKHYLHLCVYDYWLNFIWMH